MVGEQARGAAGRLGSLLQNSCVRGSEENSFRERSWMGGNLVTRKFSWKSVAGKRFSQSRDYLLLGKRKSKVAPDAKNEAVLS